MVFFVAAVGWVFFVIAMSLHKLTNWSIIEIVCWAVTVAAFLEYLFLLHR